MTHLFLKVNKVALEKIFTVSRTFDSFEPFIIFKDGYCFADLEKG